MDGSSFINRACHSAVVTARIASEPTAAALVS